MLVLATIASYSNKRQLNFAQHSARLLFPLHAVDSLYHAHHAAIRGSRMLLGRRESGSTDSVALLEGQMMSLATVSRAIGPAIKIP